MKLSKQQERVLEYSKSNVVQDVTMNTLCMERLMLWIHGTNAESIVCQQSYMI